MEVTDTGIVTDVRLEQPLKADAPMEVTDEGIVTDVRLEQPLKAPSPMVVRFVAPEISKVVSPLQFWKA
jgi:hypothetical protein